jgi:hypothetical protein
MNTTFHVVGHCRRFQTVGREKHDSLHHHRHLHRRRDPGQNVDDELSHQKQGGSEGNQLTHILFGQASSIDVERTLEKHPSSLKRPEEAECMAERVSAAVRQERNVANQFELWRKNGFRKPWRRS